MLSQTATIRNSPVKIKFGQEASKHHRQWSLGNTLHVNTSAQLCEKNRTLQWKNRNVVSYATSLEKIGLSIRKQEIRDKASTPIQLPPRPVRLKLKQKTDCYNNAYIQISKKRKEKIDWIRFNIEYGIYILWHRMKKNFEEAHFIIQNLKDSNHQLYHQINRLGKRFELLSNNVRLKMIMRRVHSETNKFKHGKTSYNTMTHQINQQKQKQFYQFEKQLNIKKPLKSNQQGEQFLQNSQERTEQFKKGFSDLTSAISSCLKTSQSSKTKVGKLFKKSITQSSQDNEHNQGKIKQLRQILQVNERRCHIIDDFAQKLQQLDSNVHKALQSSQISKKIFENIKEQDLQVDLKKCSDAKISQSISRIFIGESKIEGRGALRKKCKIVAQQLNQQGIPTKKLVRIDSPVKFSNRASIQLRIEDAQNLRENVLSRWGENAKKKTRIMEEEKNVQSFKERKKTLATGKHSNNVSKKVVSIKEEKSKRTKQLGFAKDYRSSQDSASKSQKSKSRSKKTKTQKMMSSQISASGLSFKSLRGIRSLKNINSMKSMKSITSNHTFNSSRMIKSLKTQRQLKFINGRLKKISCIRMYRDRLFKLEGDFLFQHPSAKEDLLALTNKHMQDSNLNSQLNFVSLENLFEEPESETQHLLQSLRQTPPIIPDKEPLIKQEVIIVPPKAVQLQKILERPSFILKKGKASFKQKNDRKSKKKLTKISHFNEKCVERETLHGKKQLIFSQLSHLLQRHVISKEEFLMYKSLEGKSLIRDSKVDNRQTTQEDEQFRSGLESPYRCLLSLKEKIKNNQQLSQINKYYYNLNQFEKEAEEIRKTKQIPKSKDEELFQMKMYTEIRPHLTCFKHLASTEGSVERFEALLQKNY